MLEEGSHHDLLNKPGEDERGYKHLCAAQALSMNKKDESKSEDEDEKSEAKLELEDMSQAGPTTKKKSSIVRLPSKGPGEDEGEADKEEDDQPPPNSCDLWNYSKPEFPSIGLGLFLSLLSGASWPVFSFIVTEVLNTFYSCTDLTAKLLVDANNTCAVEYAEKTFEGGSTGHLYGTCKTYNDMTYRGVCGKSLDQLSIDQSACMAEMRTSTDFW